MKIMIRTATSPARLEDTDVLNELFRTEGWQTLMTFARETARKYSVSDNRHFAEGIDHPQNQLLLYDQNSQPHPPRRLLEWTKIFLRTYSTRSHGQRQKRTGAGLVARLLW
jgi:hypothetical protein